ncbi:MAG: hypothetical protein PHW04_11330 [Candidatus Wallbacteria bacterium]|nr:hypothetical protein [Candidatus Wallbacteria bacterium]
MKKRSGIVLPVVLVLLLVLCMLGLFMNKSAQHEYRFTYRSTDHLRAIYIAQAAIQATLAHIEEKMNVDQTMRKAFVEDASGVIVNSLADLETLYQKAVTDLDTDLNSIDGANKLDVGHYTVSKLTATLSSSTIVNGQNTKYGDRIKRLTIYAMVNYRGAGTNKQAPAFDKEVTQCFDCKIADIRPVGNKYVLMVKQSGAADYDKGDHFWVKYQDDKGKSEGISIGGKPEIHLFTQYYIHSEWDTARKNQECDFFTGSASDSNSPKSLIPGWQAGDTPVVDKGKYVADNEPWTEQLKQPNTYTLSDCDKACQSSSPKKPSSGPHEVGSTLTLLDTGSGYGVEQGSECGPGIKYEQNKHPLSSNKYYFNLGLKDGRTHLFYKFCTDPCPILGDVYKVWEVVSYEAKDDKDTGTCSCGKVDSACCCTCKDPKCCQAHHVETSGWWDSSDSMTMKNEGQVKGKYQVDNGGWNKWTGKAETIDCPKNFKSQPDFGSGNAFVFKEFLKGATRRVTDLTVDKTLYDGNKLYLEGIVQTCKVEKLKLTVNHPGCLLSGDSGNAVDVNLDSSVYQPPQNKFFAPPTALSLVTNGTANLSATEMYAGICAKNSINGKIKLHGNLVTEVINKDSLSNELLYDSTLLRMSADKKYGNTNADEACFVVSISPIPQEFFDHNSLVQ